MIKNTLPLPHHRHPKHPQIKSEYSVNNIIIPVYLKSLLILLTFIKYNKAAEEKEIIVNGKTT
jgi:hypothetical protein